MKLLGSRKKWGEQIGKVLNLNVLFEDEKKDHEKAVRKMAVMKWASIIPLSNLPNIGVARKI